MNGIFISCINLGIYLRYLLDWILKQKENSKHIFENSIWQNYVETISPEADLYLCMCLTLMSTSDFTLFWAWAKKNRFVSFFYCHSRWLTYVLQFQTYIKTVNCVICIFWQSKNEVNQIRGGSSASKPNGANEKTEEKKPWTANPIENEPKTNCKQAN